MQLTDAQKKIVAGWADEGCSLAELQRRINGEFGLALTFMDVRLLALDNNIKIKDSSPASSRAVDLTKMPPPEDADLHENEGGRGGQVSVEIDRVKKPGALVNGTVTFSDGVTAAWFLDQSGRLGINPSRPGYRPSESDLRAFQEELSGLLQSRGY